MASVDLDNLTYDDLKAAGAKWLERIAKAEDREKRWREDAAKAEKIYACADDREGVVADIPGFNILHSNVSTITPALYSSTAKPDIRPRMQTGPMQDGTPNPIKEASTALEAIINTMVDDSALDEEVEGLAQDSFISGRGIIRLRFDADEAQGPDGAPVLTDERIMFECVNWDDYREGPATRWQDVPWIAFRSSISAEALEEMELRQPEIADLLQGGRGPMSQKSSHDEGDALVWEIWDRERRMVYFVPEGAGEIINIMPDPLGLDGFFPIPKPVQPITVTGRRRPTCPYRVYSELADSLETINKRITILVGQLRVRGLFVGDPTAASGLEGAQDGQVLSVANAEQLVAMGGLERAITWWPMEPTVLAIRELVQQRELVKQQIYEITGISDILRGQGAASETATAQSIKSQWGTLRVEALQTLIQRCVREVFIMAAELVARHFSDQAIMLAAGMQISPQAMQMIRAPLMHYRIDIESDSTRKADLAAQQQQAQQFLQGTAQFFQVMTPIAQATPAAIAPLVELYAAFARRFNLGPQAEQALEKLIAIGQQPPQPQGPSPEQQRLEMDAQEKMAKHSLEVERLKADVADKRMSHQLKAQELEIKAAETGLKGAKLMADMDAEDMDRDERERTEMRESGTEREPEDG